MSTASEMKYISWKNVEREHLNPQIEREMVVGDKIMLARVLMKKWAHVPLHHHHNEQVTYILEGALKFASMAKRSWCERVKCSAFHRTCHMKPGRLRTLSI
jgi:quercetin dioxygenase-like cupin family protein